MAHDKVPDCKVSFLVTYSSQNTKSSSLNILWTESPEAVDLPLSLPAAHLLDP